MKSYVTIHGERGRQWYSVAGTRTFPVKSCLPILATLPGIGPARVFLLDLEAIEPPLLALIVAHLSTKFGLQPWELEAEIRRGGIPILAEDCSVMTTARDFL